MLVRAGWRKALLTAHIASSVGWLGAVAAFFVLAMIGLRSTDQKTAESLYPTLELLGWYVIVPFSGAALATGVLQSLMTEWGLFQHYWILAKLLITVGAGVLLLVHMQLVHSTAVAARVFAVTGEQRFKLVADSAAALLVLGIAVVLSVYKPRGLTPWSVRAQAAPAVDSAIRPTAFTFVFWLVLVALVVAAIVRHLLGGMPSHFE